MTLPFVQIASDGNEFDPAERIDYDALSNVEEVDYDDQLDGPIVFDEPI